MNKLTELTSCVCIVIITISLISLISEVKATLANPDDIEYTYKDWSSYDIELAMKYHGIQACTITDTQAYCLNPLSRVNSILIPAIKRFIIHS